MYREYITKGSNTYTKYSTLAKFNVCDNIVVLTDMKNVALYQLFSLLCSYTEPIYLETKDQAHLIL